MLVREGIGGVVFLFLYSINLSILIYGYATKRIVFKSVFTFLLIHVLLRISAQSVCIALGTSETLNFGLLIAFFVLGAEGYFSLVLCSYRFLIHHHQHTYPISGSWLEARQRDSDPWYKRWKRSFTAKDDKTGKKDPWIMSIIDWAMIAANTIIIVGGTRVNGSDYGDADYYEDLHAAKIMRSVGQAMFLVINLFLINFLIVSRRQDRNPRGTISKGWAKFARVPVDFGEADTVRADGTDGRQLDGYNNTMHPMLKVLFIAWVPLIARGVFGLLQGLIDKINYANIAAYDEHGLTNTFVVVENVLAVLPEWTACCLLCICMFTRETFDPKKLNRGATELADTPGVDDNDGETLREGLGDRKASKVTA